MVNLISKTPPYSDLDLDFIPHPTTGDVVRKTGSDAIKRSIRNLILTNFYDIPFQSAIGSNAQKILFDNISPLTAIFLKDAITEVITKFEPRAILPDNGVKVSVDTDMNGYNATINFIEANREEPMVITIFLARVR